MNTKWYGDAKAACKIKNNSECRIMIDKELKGYCIYPIDTVFKINYENYPEYLGEVYVSNCERNDKNNEYIMLGEMCRYSFIYDKQDFHIFNNFKPKQPLGLMSHKFWVIERIQNILNAMNRHIQDNKKIPIEWVEEYNKLIGE